ncbi:rho GTPase-activating protein 21-A-like isoform X2 [Stylophora pistillata]|uniref:Rho GTPase-activating protein 21 n=1 Tax=Stylophora pistillata TaxID=50429 RepID=A0A2B4S689_STYPI|nr:rho GTPase-activating protein 21-A-like isoform X2 [Stylophora pistillata]PFX24563.1 Rho GTPase-activating protein 21 [Stylophora pistillata]
MASIRGNVEESELAWQQKKDIGHNPGYLPPSKLISLHRQSNGFGFTLRHFVVYPPELIRKTSEPDPGVNGIDYHVDDAERQKSQPMDTVFVRQVAPSGPADRAGLSTGDQIVSVNGHPVLGKSYSQVIELILSSQELLELGIIPKEDCVLQMVTPTLSSIPPSISVGSHEFTSQSPPPVKPKPAYRRLSSHDSPTRVMSTMTINPANSFYLKLSDKDSQSSAVHDRGSPSPSVTLRRGSVDRTAMENRSFVITSESAPYNNNLKSRSSSALESSSVKSPHMDGSYFMAATDSTGRPLALRFDKGSKMGNTLTVLEDSWTKSRSHSLPEGEMQNLEDQNRSPGGISELKKVNSVNDKYASNSKERGSLNIPPFMLSAPRTVASDSTSTTYMNTSLDMGSRQPVATDPGYRKSHPSHEETTSYLIRTIASHMNKNSPGGLKSSTVGATLLESKEGLPHRQSGDSGRWSSQTNTEMQRDSQSPHPAKVPRQSEDHVKQAGYSSQLSVYRNNPPLDEMTVMRTVGHAVSEPDPSAANKQGSPKPRRVSYLMATSKGASSSSPSDQKIWSTAPQSKGKSPLVEAFSNMLPPVMVHVSSGMELCEDVNGDEGMDIPASEQEDEVFSGTGDEKSSNEGTAQRTNRRISYVMATSSPTSKHEASLEATKEEEETKERNDQVPGILEVYKEGLLSRKLAVVDGGKRSSARSWKPVYAVLRGHVLYLHKDKNSAHQEESSDEQPISIKSSIVDIAHDYTKRKNVFRLTTFNGSEFLFQSEDPESMMSWIEAIQANNNPDEDENGVSSQSLIIRRMKTVEQETSGTTAASSGHKMSPPVNTKIHSLGISNIKKSLSFRNITAGPKGEGGKNHGNKFTKKRKKPQHPNSYPSGHSVGVPLELCPSSKSNKFVPLIVEHCCEVVEKKGLETVGVYRVPGNSAAVTALQEELNNRGIENICLEEEKWNDVNNITSLMKLFLRKLPEGLVTADLYDGFIEANKKEDATERMWAIRSMVQELPDYNFETLKSLVNHLKLVSDNCDKNKMEVRNLAIVFGPTIIRTGDDSMMAMVKDMSDQCRIVETLISECDWFFEESEGDECPVKALPPGQETLQEHILSQNVLSSLGQVAVNFGDDGSYKPKSSGISLHIPKFRSGKSSKSDSGQGSSSDGPLSDSQGSEGSPPLERSPVVRVLSGDGSRSNSPTMERSTRFSGKRSTESAPGSLQLVLEPPDAEFRAKGPGSLKAYSYAMPPPPSYRRVSSQKRSSSPGSPEQPLAPFDVTFAMVQDTETKKSPDEPPSDQDNTPKPSFSSFSEETRRRLLRLNLQKKAAEKRRQSEDRGVTSPTSPHSERSVDVPRERKMSDQGVFESTDQPSSSSTSRSSSTHSSKNPSLDSLHVTVQPYQDKMAGVTVHSEAARINNSVKAMPFPNEVVHHEPSPRSDETVVAVVKGRGVVSGTLRQLETSRRPASLDLKTKRDSSEEHRLARRSLGSEESSDTSSDEGNECAISMSRTFDEKLRILLDLENTYGNKESRVESQNDGDRSSVRGEPLKRPIPSGVDMAQRRSSVEPGRIYKIVGVSPSTDSQGEMSSASNSETTTTPRKAENPVRERKSNSVIEINTSKYFTVPSSDDRPKSQPSSPPRRVSVESTPEVSSRKVGTLRQRFESTSSRLSDNTTPRSSSQNRGRDFPSSFAARRKIGSVHTTTPVSLKEFNVKPSVTKTPGGQPVQVAGSSRGMKRETAQRPPESRTVSSRNIRLESSPAKHLSTSPARFSSGRTDRGLDWNVPRSRMNVSLVNDRSKGQPVVTKTQAAPRVVSREYGTKSKLLSHKDSAKELLPSKARIPSRDARGSQTQRKLEKDAQHIAELLEEMHSERHLHLSRQQSDISGQAQKAAAQRAAFRSRRRSLGDDNNPSLVQQRPTSPGQEKESLPVYKGREVSQGNYRAWPREVDSRPDSPQRGSRGVYTVTS